MAFVITGFNDKIVEVTNKLFSTIRDSFEKYMNSDT
jgi:hypothetical protein